MAISMQGLIALFRGEGILQVTPHTPITFLCIKAMEVYGLIDEKEAYKDVMQGRKTKAVGVL